MKKNIFSKLMACLVVLSCAFIISACGVFQKEDTNVKSIVIDENTIPEVIIIGEFDNAGIEALITYDNETTETIAITTAMIPERYQSLLNEPGIYRISIMFRNATTELTVRMVNSTNIYQVNFYNNKNQLITTQFVYDGEDATLPSEIMTNVEGWAFTGWDRSHENISEDTNIYGLYVNIENTLSDVKMQKALLDAEQYYITNSHFTSVEEITTYDDQTSICKQTINYHYDSEKELATSQSVYLSEGIKLVTIFDETEAEYLYLSTIESAEYEKNKYEDIEAEWDEDDEGISFEQMLAISKLYGGVEFYTFNELLTADNFAPSREVIFGYEITANKLIYTCTIILADSGDWGTDVNTYIIKYDDEKVLQIINNYVTYTSEDVEGSVYNATYNIDYIELKFEDLIPNYGDVDESGVIDVTDSILIQQYLAETITLTDEQLVVADVNLDGNVDQIDVSLIKKYLAKWIEYLPYPYIVGDIDLDGEVGTHDVTRLIRYLGEVETLTGEQKVCADINIDNEINKYDFSILFKYVGKWDIELPFTYTLGDVNFDGEIGARDASIVLQYLDDTIELTGIQVIVADVNCDNKITDIDAYLINAYATKSIELPFTEVFGDINADGEINTRDVAILQQYLTEQYELSNEQLVVADVNIDGNIDAFDMEIIQNYVLTKITGLPFAYKLGDVNMDGDVNSKDVLRLARFAEEMENLTDEQLICSDVNLDGRVDSFDTYLLARHFAGWNIKLPFSYICGDVNLDNTINEQDTVLLNQYIAGTSELSNEQSIVADVNLDENIDEIDVKIIRMHIVGGYGIDTLPFTKNAAVKLFENAMQNGLSGDITITQNGKWSDEDEANTTMQIDFVNKVARGEYSADELYYAWESEDSMYEVFTLGSAADCEKITETTFSEYMDKETVFGFIGNEMIYGGSYDGVEYEFVGIEIVDGNFVITINASSNDDNGELSGTIKYTFNKDYILSQESTYDFVGTYTYDYSDITVEIPEDIKALEDSAVEQ